MSKTMKRIIGVDPGGKQCGITVASRSKAGTLLYLDHRLVRRPKDHEYASPHGLDRWAELISDVMLELKAHRKDTIVAVERINAYGFQGNQSLNARISFVENAYTAGVLAGRFDAVTMLPFGHGKHPLHRYPPQLIGPGETSGHGQLRTCRAAWDTIKSANRIIESHQIEIRVSDDKKAKP